MKISNIHVGTIHRNMRISNWAVSYFHISFIFSYQFHIFISVSYFHISFIFSPFDVWFLRGRLIFSYQFHIFISVSYFHISLQFSCHNSITSLCVASQPVSHVSDWNRQFPHASRWNWSHQTKTNVHVGTLSLYWFNVTMTLNSFTPTSATALRGRQR